MWETRHSAGSRPRPINRGRCRPRASCIFEIEIWMFRLRNRRQTVAGLALTAGICLPLTGCGSAQAVAEPSIEFTRVPAAGEGSPDQLEQISGRIKGALPGERVVLFALSGLWWVQPQSDAPFTAIRPDSTWRSSTHPGSAYAALLVDSRYRPPLTVNALPDRGGPVL